MDRTPQQLKDDALAIWQAGVDSVDSERLVREHLRADADHLHVDSLKLAWDDIDSIAVVGAGKAGAGMAAGVEAALADRLDDKRVHGWVNVPADCVRSLQQVTLHAARPAGVNEPTEEGVRGAEEILRIVGELGPRDLCLGLISGGGSALLPAPAVGVTLKDKVVLTKHLSGAGANIEELNTVRKQLSRIKGGGLARHCRAGTLATLIISDVIGDPLDVIASGPTVPDSSSPAEALRILDRFQARDCGASPAVWEHLQQQVEAGPPAAPSCRRVERIVGNNAVAVQAAGAEARRRGYETQLEPAESLEGAAEQVGQELARRASVMRRGQLPCNCLITGGEPTVELAPPGRRGLGGRNQQLVLAALQVLRQDPQGLRQILLLSGGTDGEDGPTDAAGAWIGELLESRIDQPPDDWLARNDAYHYFQQIDGLIQTGPTHTNVCDIRVAIGLRGAQRPAAPY